MAQQSSTQKNITLIGEIHDSLPTHLTGFEDLVKEKLKTKDVVVILGIEDDNIPTLTIQSQPTLRRGQKTSSQQIDEFKTIHHRQEYKEMFQRLLSDIPHNKKIIVVGIDDAELAAAKDSVSLGTTRDRAMKAKIEDACNIHGASELICAIGSAHIFDPTDKKQDQGKRLGSILNADPSINLRVENFYSKGTLSYTLVQKDIDAFKQYHQAKEEERYAGKGLSLSSSRESLVNSPPRTLSDEYMLAQRIHKLENSSAAKTAGIIPGASLDQKAIIKAFVDKVRQDSVDPAYSPTLSRRSAERSRTLST